MGRGRENGTTKARKTKAKQQQQHRRPKGNGNLRCLLCVCHEATSGTSLSL